MGTVGDDLTLVQAKLHDNGAIWTRTELLRWFQDGYRELLAKSSAFSALHPLDMPGRHSYALTYAWETAHSSQGTWWVPMLSVYAGARGVTAAWEAEHLDGVTPSAAYVGLTEQWERAHTTQSDRHFSFALPTDHERIRRIEWNNKALLPASVREFDEQRDAWMRQAGEARWWTTGVGAIRSIEVYEIDTTYQQAYDLPDANQGIPREPTGSRTYAIEVDRYNSTNSYAYATQGEMQAMKNRGMAFVPASAYCNTWELSEPLITPAYNFTINLTMNFPGLQYVVIHPWEYAEVSGPSLTSDATSPGERGMFAWEADPNETYQAQVLLSDNLITLTGMGSRFTGAATTKSNGFYVFVWEQQHLDGATVTTQTGVAGRGMFPWEIEFGTKTFAFGLGTVRSISSPDRQYLPMVSEPASAALLGGIRDWRSSTDNLMVLEVIVPVIDLVETDRAVLIPEPLQKYLRYFTWMRAFGREGPGQRMDLAQHYEQRFQRGVQLFKRFADCAHADRTFRRQDERIDRSRPPQVRFPSEFQAYW